MARLLLELDCDASLVEDIIDSFGEDDRFMLISARSKSDALTDCPSILDSFTESAQELNAIVKGKTEIGIVFRKPDEFGILAWYVEQNTGKHFQLVDSNNFVAISPVDFEGNTLFTDKHENNTITFRVISSVERANDAGTALLIKTGV